MKHPVKISSTNKNVFFYFQNGEQEGKNSSCLGGWNRGRTKDIRKGCREENVVEISCIMYENGKMRPVEPIPGMEEGRNKGKRQRG
jgi:hypothetical protein